jgi:anthranilate phosphoribosyltransferase
VMVAGLAPDLAAGVRAAAESVDGGAAAARLEAFTAATRRLAGEGA